MRCKTINYKGKRWEKLRKSVLKRDGYMCRVCRRYGKRVDAEVVHHIYPVSDYPEYRWCSWNLLSLCGKCHDKLHDRTNNELTARGKVLKERTIPPPLL